MASTPLAESSTAVPVLLLKTKSSPGDSYEDLFSKTEAGFGFDPTFVPVLQHRFDEDGLSVVKRLLVEKRVSTAADASYGGLIFTSQRAVEAFTKLVEEGRAAGESYAELNTVPVYSVGPATTRTLSAVPTPEPLTIHGSHTGNGEALAAFMLSHYAEFYSSRSIKPPLLFLVGEQRRDIIPKTLMDDALGKERRIEVIEVPVYGTGVMESFPDDFSRVLGATASRPVRWVIVFSPTGCEGMLRGLGMLDDSTGQVKHGINGSRGGSRSTFIATIGPTTRDYLKRTFGFEPDVCAETPSPEGIRDGIIQFMNSLYK